jgi:uncharacterized protein YdeI (BOF family)
MRLRRKVLTGVVAVAATVGCVIGLMTGPALAETTTTGIGATVVSSIADLIANPAADQVVTVSGTIAAGTEGNEYTLTDATGTIKIDGGPAWYLKTALVIGQVYTITGEFDMGKDGKGPAEIGIFTATGPDGTVTTVRTGGGRPPWAGGPNRNGQLPSADETDDDAS